MKNIFAIIIITLFAISLSSCGNKKSKEEAGTHKHEDGTVHRNDAHSHENDARPNQESFEVKADNGEEHNHEDGDDHDHAHVEHK